MVITSASIAAVDSMMSLSCELQHAGGAAPNIRMLLKQRESIEMLENHRSCGMYRD